MGANHLTDRDKLKVYDILRDMHGALSSVSKFMVSDDCDDADRNAINAVDSVLYLAEGHFARMSD